MVHIRPVVVRALRPAAALALAAAMMAVPATAQPASPDAINAQGRSRTLPVITRNEDLLAKFGGRDGLVRIMDDFMINLLADPRTRPFFENSDQARIKRQLVDQFCVIMAGPCSYDGRSMAEAHAGMGVATANFYALVEALQKAMNKHDVPFAAQNRLVAALAPMHRDVITK
jgi:hemoglobin